MVALHFDIAVVIWSILSVIVWNQLFYPWVYPKESFSARVTYRYGNSLLQVHVFFLENRNKIPPPRRDREFRRNSSSLQAACAASIARVVTGWVYPREGCGGRVDTVAKYVSREFDRFCCCFSGWWILSFRKPRFFSMVHSSLRMTG